MAKHLSAADKEIEKKQRRKKRIIIFSVVFFVMAAAAVAELTILKSMTSVDRRFMREAERGVASGWESSLSDLQLKEQGRITNVSFIDTEYEAVKIFANKSFQDKQLKKLAKRYINDLKKCRNAALAHGPETDSDAFWDGFAEPYTDRLIVLSKLYLGDYKIGSSWDEYPEVLDEVLSKAWAAEIIPQIKFTRAGSKNGIGEFNAELRNDSGFDIEYLNINLEIYDSKDALVGTAEVIKENIADGSSAELVFYFSDQKVSFYRIAGIDCIASRKAVPDDGAVDTQEDIEEETSDDILEETGEQV